MRRRKRVPDAKPGITLQDDEGKRWFVIMADRQLVHVVKLHTDEDKYMSLKTWTKGFRDEGWLLV